MPNPVTGLNNQVPARDFGYESVQYLRRNIGFGVQATAIEVGKLPPGAIVVGGGILVKTAFNAGSTNPVAVGFGIWGGDAAANSSYYGSSAGAAGFTAITLTAVQPSTTERQVTVTYTPTGTAASAGEAEVIVTFVTPKG